jgi:hypothetical protein
MSDTLISITPKPDVATAMVEKIHEIGLDLIFSTLEPVFI